MIQRVFVAFIVTPPALLCEGTLCYTCIMTDTQAIPKRFSPVLIFGAHGRIGNTRVVVIDDDLDESGYATVDTPDGKDSVYLPDVCDLAMPMDSDFAPAFNEAVGLTGYLEHAGRVKRVEVVDVAERIQQVVVRTKTYEYLVVKLSDVSDWEKPLDVDDLGVNNFSDE